MFEVFVRVSSCLECIFLFVDSVHFLESYLLGWKSSFLHPLFFSQACVPFWTNSRRMFILILRELSRKWKLPALLFKMAEKTCGDKQKSSLIKQENQLAIFKYSECFELLPPYSIFFWKFRQSLTKTTRQLMVFPSPNFRTETEVTVRRVLSNPTLKWRGDGVKNY